MKVLRTDFNCSSEQLTETLKNNPDCEFVHYRHRTQLVAGENLITEARKNKESHAFLLTLANHGFYLYMTREGDTSSFVQHKRLPTLWNLLRFNKGFYSEQGVVYTFDTEPSGHKSLLVIFSSINGPIYQSSLNRYFTQNFRKISNFIPSDTLVMRIADLGGITGSYYLNNNYFDNNEQAIQSLIREVKSKYSLERVVLMGASKGGSGAMYHGLLGDYDFVAVDPIVTDEFYFTKFNDLHFMRGVASISKEESFKLLLQNKVWNINKENKIIITSRQSPQYHYISDIVLKKYGENFSVFKNTNLEIKSHPEVSPNSLFKTTELVGKCLSGERVKTGEHHFLEQAQKTGSKVVNKNDAIKSEVLPRIISETKFFKMTYLDNKSDILFITFNGISSGLETPVFGRDFLLKKGYSVIGCNQRKGSFYQDLSFSEFKEIIEPYCKKYKNVYLYGSSLGGYCAIYYAGAVNGTVIAASPRLTLHPAMVENNILSHTLKKHAENTEFRHMELHDVPATSGKIHVFHDPMNPGDKFFIELIKKYRALSLNIHEVSYAGHATMIKCLRRSGFFSDIWNAIMQGEIDKVKDIIKGVKRNEFQYFNILNHLHRRLKWNLNSILDVQQQEYIRKLQEFVSLVDNS